MSKEPKAADQALVRSLNTSRVLNCLRTHHRISRADLARALGLNRSTVSSVVAELLGERLVTEAGLESPTTGRPGMLLELNPNGGSAVGVEIGVGYISAILTDFTAQILWRDRASFSVGQERDEIVSLAEQLVWQALEIGECRDLRPMGVGVGVPGLVDLESGTLLLAPNLGWEHVPIQDMWEAEFELPVFVENEANAAALGEYYFGCARDVPILLYLSAGVGLGGGIVINGRLFRGSAGFAGEVGHMTIDPEGELCGCGKRGCWETLVGPRAIVRSVRESIESNRRSLISELVEGDLSLIDVDVILEAARAGDALAVDTLENVGVQLGIGIANLLNAFNPDMVVLGGALNLMKRFLLPAMERTVREHALMQPWESVELGASAHGVDACVIGAATLVLDDVLRQPRLPW